MLLGSSPSDEDLDLLKRGRERQTATLRSRVYWALVGMAVLVAVPTLFVSHSQLQVWSVLGVTGFAALLAIWLADYVVGPVLALKRRLELKNYGEQEPVEKPDVDLDLSRDAFELGAAIASMLPRQRIDVNVGLPVELAAIEKLARAGRVSELAMESVKRDLHRHLSHGLKTPLALMIEHGKVASQALSRGDLEAAQKSVESMNADGMTIANLVEQILSLSWVDGLSEQSIGNQRTNLSATVMELLGSRAPALDAKQMRLEHRVDAGLWVRGRQQLLYEMFSALLDNAIRYGPAGSPVMLNAHRLPGTRSIIVTVVDRGPGIPAQERERVFEAFYGSMGLDSRGNMTYGSRRHRALGAGVERNSHGLGLAVVRAVAKLHGANVTLAAGSGGIGLSVQIVMAASTPPSDETSE